MHQQSDGGRRKAALRKLESLGVQYPIMQAGMGGGIAGPTLAAAVSAAGGIGTLGLQDVSTWEKVLEQTKIQAGGRPFSVNLLLPYTRSRHIDAVIRQNIPMATLFWGDGRPLIQQLHRYEVFVFKQVGSKSEAEQALDAGIDGLIVQGFEAGGHVRGNQRLNAILPEIAELTSTIPIFAAGGVYTAQDARRAISLGASGVCTGTRFLLTPESDAHEAYRQRLLAADETIVTRLFGLGWPEAHRVVPNKATQKWCRKDGTIPTWLQALNSAMTFTRKIVPMKASLAATQRPGLPIFSPIAPVRELPAELVEATALYAREHVGRIRDIVPARVIVKELADGVMLELGG